MATEGKRMIRLVRGLVAGKGKDFLVVDVGSATGGIGYKVTVPDVVALRVNVNSTIVLHTYLQVREDAQTLFGFENEDELGMFEMLLGVNGVGPKVAMATLSVLSPDALRMALANEEPALIARVPGVGKRTAEKIVLELKGKVKPGGGNFAGIASMVDADMEVVEALIALGYSVVESQRAVQGLPKDVTGVEDRLRLALSRFGQ
jgi:Holliday junction DNA helicase RuvA